MTGRNIPAQATESPGNYVTSALWNTQVNGLYSFNFNPPYFKGAASTSQSIPNGGVWTVVPMTGAITDTEGGWSSSAPSIYTFQTAGRYLCIGSIFIPTNGTTDTSSRGVGLWQSGTPLRLVEGANGPNVGFSQSAVYTGYFAVGSTIGLEAAQSSTSALSTSTTAIQQPGLELIWLGAH